MLHQLFHAFVVESVIFRRLRTAFLTHILRRISEYKIRFLVKHYFLDL